MDEFGTLVYNVPIKHSRKAAISSLYLEVHQKSRLIFEWVEIRIDG